MGISLKIKRRRRVWVWGLLGRRMKFRKLLKIKLDGVFLGCILLFKKNIWVERRVVIRLVIL